VVEVLVELGRQAIALEPITVTGRREDPRHAATFEGFLARRAEARPVGPDRVVLSTDPEMAAVMSVSDVLRWFPRARGCLIVFLDGRRTSWPVLEMSTSLFEGVEFYQYGMTKRKASAVEPMR
jgi:hypothetical protein